MKRICSFLVALFMLLAICLPVCAADQSVYADALRDITLFRGTDKGYELESSLTREQGVTMILRLLGKEKTALAKPISHPFADTKNYTWFDPYLGFAYAQEITKGVSDTVFGYGAVMTEAQFLTMVLRVLGYHDADDGSGDFTWDNPYMLAEQVGLVEGERKAPFLRGDMVEVCWNAILADRADSEKPTIINELIETGVVKESEFKLVQKALQDAMAPDETESETTGGSSYSSRPYVSPIPPKLTIDKADEYISLGQGLKITATVQGTSAPVTWSSSEPSVASVEGGVVTPLKVGITRITAQCGSLSAACNVTVSEPSIPNTESTPWTPMS